ncbi:MAG TPA: tetratricopeptide repeat protein [Bacteroidia bacterium]|nr:tetratricopeptide repeat protein [Bacteroidia bacterium]HRS59111.1 tetratricopeptide repeat protein [Bacteroidia bacterium]HRU69124.1 tetratricopeptide repeat protein [Bacteroidia bacterium]
MATVQILKCQACGAPLEPSILECEYCHSVNIVKTETNPFILDPKLSNKYARFYKEKLKENPEDAQALYSVGLFYMNLKLYDQAIENFRNAIKQMPENPDLLYYYALALLKGQKPRKLQIKEVKQIEEYLYSAIQLDDKAKYYYYAAMLRKDFYEANFLKYQGLSFNDLMNMAKTSDYELEEINILLENCPIKDESLTARIKSNS